MRTSHIAIPSPAIAVVGRHNSGKTTLVEAVIAELSARGLDVGSIKHHGHAGFDIDKPGKDSYRHRAAGATETVVAAPGLVARMKTIEGELECRELVASMPGHDVVVVEGYRKSGLPTIEVMRSGNDADRSVAELFARGAREGWSLGEDFSQLAREASRGDGAEASADLRVKMPDSNTVAVVTDIPEAAQAGDAFGIPVFGLDDIAAVADFVQAHYARPKLTVVIQAGGQSRRMGRSKATVPFAGRPLISHMVERMLPVADELVITTNEPDNLAFLFDEYPQATLRLVTDVVDRRGALPGFLTALSAASNPFVALVACDMAFASPALVAAEASKMAESEADAVVPVNKHGFEPFHAVYRRDVCLPQVRRLVEAGCNRMQELYDHVSIFPFPQDLVQRAEPMGGCFMNANTPEELAMLERFYLER